MSGDIQNRGLDGPTTCAIRVCPWLAICLLCLVPSSLPQIAKGPPRIRNVYIPSDQLEVLFGSSAQGVLMPREKILTLWEEGQR